MTMLWEKIGSSLSQLYLSLVGLAHALYIILISENILFHRRGWLPTLPSPYWKPIYQPPPHQKKAKNRQTNKQTEVFTSMPPPVIFEVSLCKPLVTQGAAFCLFGHWSVAFWWSFWVVVLYHVTYICSLVPKCLPCKFLMKWLNGQIIWFNSPKGPSILYILYY